MKTNIMALLLLGYIVILSLSSCKDKYPEEYPGHFPDNPLNFSDVNTEYDDYNSDIPLIWGYNFLDFSSNRNSAGQQFDIVGIPMRIEWHKNNAILSIRSDSIDYFKHFEAMIDTINSPDDEYGPYSVRFRVNDDTKVSAAIHLLMYSSGNSGDQDIYFVYTVEDYHYEEFYTSSPEKLSILDTSANELYPSFFGSDFYLHDEWGNRQERISSMYYSSDIKGNYDIFCVNLPQESGILDILSSDEQLESKRLDINSGFDDHCPYVNGNLMVFSSNRSGGFGGYDLYYSRYANFEWSEPINFGEQINSEFDEFRPVTRRYPGFENSLMIFSSNREGGKGGYDLYYVGIENMIE